MLRVYRRKRRISELPEDIVQHILSFLSTKESAVASLLSKAWLCAWSTSTNPVLDFDDACVKGEYPVFKERGRKLAEFAGKTLLRYNEHKVRIQKLSLNILDENLELTCKLIRLASECGVQELCLSLTRAYGSTFAPAIFDVHSLIKLELQCCNIQEVQCSPITCHSLQVLKLCLVSLDEQIIEKLMCSCPLIDTIIIGKCSGLKKVQINNQHHLRIFEIEARYCETVDIKVPSLESFTYLEGWSSTSVGYPFTIQSIHNVKRLCLRLKKITDEFIRKIVSEFSLLQDLTLHCCPMLKRLVVSSHSLKSINLWSCDNLTDLYFDAPNLLSLDYRSDNRVPGLSFNCTPTKLKIKLCIKHAVEHSGTLFFQKLRECLAQFNHSEMSLPRICVSEVSFTFEDLRAIPLPYPEPEVEEMSLSTYSPTQVYPLLVDALFWTCHPNSICMDECTEPSRDFIKLLCESLIDKRTTDCCRSDQVKCWRHYFKGVKKIEVFKGSTGKDYWLPLCWRFVADVVPTLRFGDKFRFRLECQKVKGKNSETICYMEDAPSVNRSIIQSTSVADPRKVLKLYWVSLDEQIIEKLMCSCPLIDTFILDKCYGFKKVRIYNQYHLRIFEIKARFGKTVDIKVPSLESFSYSEVGSSTSMGYPFTIQSIHKVYFDAPNLLSLDYCSYERVPSLSFNSTTTKLKMNLCIKLVSGCSGTLFFQKLRECLASINHSELSLPYICAAKFRFSFEDLRAILFPYPAPEVEELTLSTFSPTQVYPLLVDALFWTCRPKSILMDECTEPSKDFIKLLCESLMDQRTTECCSSHLVKCWRQYFKRVTKIEIFKGSTRKDYWLPLCWRSVADVVPNLRFGDKFRFRLEWSKSTTEHLIFVPKSSQKMKGKKSETICYMEDTQSANGSIIQSTSVADPCKMKGLARLPLKARERPLLGEPLKRVEEEEEEKEEEDATSLVTTENEQAICTTCYSITQSKLHVMNIKSQAQKVVAPKRQKTLAPRIRYNFQTRPLKVSFIVFYYFIHDFTSVITIDLDKEQNKPEGPQSAEDASDSSEAVDLPKRPDENSKSSSDAFSSESSRVTEIVTSTPQPMFDDIDLKFQQSQEAINAFIAPLPPSNIASSSTKIPSNQAIKAILASFRELLARDLVDVSIDQELSSRLNDLIADNPSFLSEA
ncbi:hypothetical protein RJ640_006835 [Escallonia rubra]|uniref:F-box domain-containing protein n=1 Tax=Escallonia rubra TaxID=112253 RepID=A0AA88U3B0_9ASTE|nr:hypothetical protein RJ640_006835 [Escallonia rubra]